MGKQNSALNNLQRLICHKTQPNQSLHNAALCDAHDTILCVWGGSTTPLQRIQSVYYFKPHRQSGILVILIIMKEIQI